MRFSEQNQKNKVIRYRLYGIYYAAKSQAECMSHIFENVIQKNADKLSHLLHSLSCISDIDYNDIDNFGRIQDDRKPPGDLPVLREGHRVPYGFRSCYTFYLDGQTVCVGNSYNWTTKQAFINKLIQLCDENKKTLDFNVTGDEPVEFIELDVYRKRQSLNQPIRYRLFGEIYHTNQAEFMINVFSEAFHRKPSSIGWSIKNLRCVSRIDYRDPINQIEIPAAFRSCQTLRIGQEKICIGTGYNLKDKLRQIDYFLRANGFEKNACEILKYPAARYTLMKYQEDAVEQVLKALERNPYHPQVGIISMPLDAGKTMTMIEIIRSLQKHYPGKWSYLVITDRIGRTEQLEAQASNSLFTGRVENRRALQYYKWERDKVTISTFHQYTVAQSRLAYPTKEIGDPMIVKDPVFIIIDEAARFTAGFHMSAILQMFSGAHFLAFTNVVQEEQSLVERFGPYLYRLTYEEAIRLKLAVPVYFECKDYKIRKDSVEFIINHFTSLYENKKAIVICETRKQAFEYCKLTRERLSSNNMFIHFPETPQYHHWIKQFQQAAEAIIFMAHIPPGLNIPELSVVYAAKAIKSAIALSQLIEKVSSPYPGKKNGLIMLLNTAETELQKFDLPFVRANTNHYIEADAIIDVSEATEHSFEDIMARFRQAIHSQDYRRAFTLLIDLKRADTDRYALVANDFAYLFNPDNSLENNERNWSKYWESAAYKASLWYLLTDESDRIPQEEEIFSEEAADLEPDGALSYREATGHPQEIGRQLEVHVLNLIRELFDIEEAENDTILDELRRQLSGNQFGFDLKFVYKDSAGHSCTCMIECKNISSISLADVTGKLEQLRSTGQTIHHWILISPYGRVANDLANRLPVWEDELFWNPVQKVQIWTPENDVGEFFGLIPDVFDKYYQDSKSLHPDQWSDEKRAQVKRKWKQKVTPALPLPSAWRNYLRNHQNLLTLGEQDGRLIKDYENIYGRHIQLRCFDKAGTLLDGTAERYVLDWLRAPGPSALFVLGEFGDGKTFLTYSLARRLSEEFVKSPDTGFIPLRMALSELKPQTSPQDFLRLRLEAFGAQVDHWASIRHKHNVLVILDGFDEMSTGMDLRSVEANALRLCNATSLFPGVKLLVTSRLPVFKSIKTRLMERFEPCEVLQLAPIGLQDKLAFLSSYADENGCRERLQQLRAVHDIMGLASKPLFLEMMKTTMLAGEIGEVDSLSLYSSYVNATLHRKIDLQFERSDSLVNRQNTLGNLILLLEDFALISNQYGTTRDLSVEEFKHYKNQPELAKKLWEHLISPTSEDNEDADNRFVNRSLLKATSQGYAFCHRSMQEYFLAGGLCRMLRESPGEAEKFLCDTDLSYETIGFAGRILNKLLLSEAAKVQSSLTSMICKTRGQSPENPQMVRLGSSALNLYYSVWLHLPETDWRNLVLDNVRIPEADLSGKDLSGTSLRYANLDNVNLTNTNLTNCDLTGVRFEETKDVYAMRPATEDRVYLHVLYSDGTLRKWDIHNNQHMITTVLDRDKLCNIALSDYGLVFFNRETLQFSTKTSNGIKIHGGVRCCTDKTILDIQNKNILYKSHGKLSYYNISNQAHVIDGYPIKDNTKAMIVNDTSVLLYQDQEGVRLLRKSGEHAEVVIVKGILDEQKLTGITVIDTFQSNGNAGLYQLCIGYKSGNIDLYSFTISGDGSAISGSIELNHISSYHSLQYIRALCFLGVGSIVYTGLDGILYALQVNEFNELSKTSQWKLAVQCKGCIIDGLKQHEQYDKLKTYQQLTNT